jgi:hypothetical protein
MSQAYCLFALVIVHIVLDTADRQTQKLMNFAHPFGVARGEIIVDRDDVNAAPGQPFKYDGKVATSVLPSPVRISAILP